MRPLSSSGSPFSVIEAMACAAGWRQIVRWFTLVTKWGYWVATRRIRPQLFVLGARGRCRPPLRTPRLCGAVLSRAKLFDHFRRRFLLMSLSQAREALSRLLSLTGQDGSPVGPTARGDRSGELSSTPETSARADIEELLA